MWQIILLTLLSIIIQSGFLVAEKLIDIYVDDDKLRQRLNICCGGAKVFIYIFVIIALATFLLTSLSQPEGSTSQESGALAQVHPGNEFWTFGPLTRPPQVEEIFQGQPEYELPQQEAPSATAVSEETITTKPLPMNTSNTNIVFQSNPPQIKVGQCSSLFWLVTGNDVESVQLENQQVPTRYDFEVCPETTKVYTLTVQFFNGNVVLRQVVVTVTNNMEKIGPTPSPSPTATVSATVMATASDIDENIDSTGTPTVTSTPTVSTVPTVDTNTPPIILTDNFKTLDEGGSVDLSATAQDDNNCSKIEWDMNGDGAFEYTGQSSTFSAAELDGPSYYYVNVRAVDCEDENLIDAESIEIFVANVAPSASVSLSTTQIQEGDESVIQVSDLFDPSHDDLNAGLNITYSCSDQQVIDAENVTDTSFTCQYPQNGTYTASVRIVDKDGGEVYYPLTITVNNVAPSIQEISVSPEIGVVTWNIRVKASFSDPGITDNFSVECDWGDGNTTIGSAEMIEEIGTAFCNYNYTAPGNYTISLSLADGDNGEDTATIDDYIVIGDAGRVSGSGIIDSPEGAYINDPTFEGEGQFSFNIMSGDDGWVNGRFHFRLENGFGFQATNFEWFTLNESVAQVQGEGSINNEEGFTFVLSVLDGQFGGLTGDDMIRVQIINTETGEIVYDTQIGDLPDVEPTTELVSGDIMINPINAR